MKSSRARAVAGLVSERPTRPSTTRWPAPLVVRKPGQRWQAGEKFCMCNRKLRLLFLLWPGLFALAFPVYSQTMPEEPVPGPDSHETGQGPHGHLFGDWGGERTRLEKRGVTFDFQYVSDSLWNLKSVQKERFASWNRFRGTVDIDFGELTGWHDLYF